MAYSLNICICLYYAEAVEIFGVQESCMCGSKSLHSSLGAHRKDRDRSCPIKTGVRDRNGMVMLSSDGPFLATFLSLAGTLRVIQ